MRWPFRKSAGPPRTLRRSFVTPEGVDLRLELAGAGARAAAFLIDAIFILVTLVLFTLLILYLALASKAQIMIILWLVGAFLLRNGWFSLFEMGPRSATPGKRLIGLRVVARDGARLTAGAVIARNAMREVEIFLPLSFLGAQAAEGAADAWLILFALGWTGLLLFFPLMNRDRLRAGDLIAGTWVVRAERDARAADFLEAAERPRRRFSEAALELYGVYELQTLEEVLRGGRGEAIATVADAIRRKAGIEDDHGGDHAFLTDYYAALCERLERGLLVGRRREDKHWRERQSA
ncbi:MAG: RDD family protein [Allosphingosinicella sp.]